MPYASPFVKLNIEGHFGSSATDLKEFWNAGLHIASPSAIVATPTELTSFLTSISSAVSTFHSAAGNLVGTSCFLDSLSAALIGTDGNYALGALQSTTRYTYGSPVAGGGTSRAPWSQAIVWTLRSLILRGPGSHGRCYYPATAADALVGTGLLTSTIQNTISSNVQTVLNAINSAATTNLATSSNVSLVSPIGLGVRAPVTRVGIGARLDSMESRERNLPEAWVFKNLTVTALLAEERNEEYREQLEDYYEQLERDRDGA